jgi:hypothetical protein
MLDVFSISENNYIAKKPNRKNSVGTFAQGAIVWRINGRLSSKARIELAHISFVTLQETQP